MRSSTVMPYRARDSGTRPRTVRPAASREGLRVVFGESGAVGRDPVDDDAEKAVAKSAGCGLYGVGVEVTGEGDNED